MMAVRGSTAHLLARMGRVLALSEPRRRARSHTFRWACALHAGTYETYVEELGQQVAMSCECWALTTIGGETLNVTADVVLAMDRDDTAMWWMGNHPVVLERTPLYLPEEPLKMLFATHMEGPDPMRLADCNLDYRSLIRPSDFAMSIVLACASRPPGLPL